MAGGPGRPIVSLKSRHGLTVCGNCGQGLIALGHVSQLFLQSNVLALHPLQRGAQGQIRSLLGTELLLGGGGVLDETLDQVRHQLPLRPRRRPSRAPERLGSRGGEAGGRAVGLSSGLRPTSSPSAAPSGRGDSGCRGVNRRGRRRGLRISRRYEMRGWRHVAPSVGRQYRTRLVLKQGPKAGGCRSFILGTCRETSRHLLKLVHMLHLELLLMLLLQDDLPRLLQVLGVISNPRCSGHRSGRRRRGAGRGGCG
mmetsp:Transcript_767/g.2919  ORF Transcript_767/g.2919 Transcript_767/m.2919 type:complete len:254 (+) Transcript_767:231-992(+)